MSKYHFSASERNSKNEGAFKISGANFPELKGIAIQDLLMAVGGYREPHTHPNAMQMDYCIYGRGEVGIVGPSGERHIIELVPGDAAFIPSGYVHWIKNVADEQSRFILITSDELPQTIEIGNVFASIPPELK